MYLKTMLRPTRITANLWGEVDVIEGIHDSPLLKLTVESGFTYGSETGPDGVLRYGITEASIELQAPDCIQPALLKQAKEALTTQVSRQLKDAVDAAVEKLDEAQRVLEDTGPREEHDERNDDTPQPGDDVDPDYEAAVADTPEPFNPDPDTPQPGGQAAPARY